VNYIVVRDAAGHCVGCGQNDGEYAPQVPAGGTTEISALYVPVDPTPEDTRLAAIDGAIATNTFGTVAPKTIAELKAMSAAEYSAWFDLNVTTPAQAIGVLKRLALVIIRRLL
jgi:hypothetical protein